MDAGIKSLMERLAKLQGRCELVVQRLKEQPGQGERDQLSDELRAIAEEAQTIAAEHRALYKN